LPVAIPDEFVMNAFSSLKVLLSKRMRVRRANAAPPERDVGTLRQITKRTLMLVFTRDDIPQVGFHNTADIVTR